MFMYYTNLNTVHHLRRCQIRSVLIIWITIHNNMFYRITCNHLNCYDKVQQHLRDYNKWTSLCGVICSPSSLVMQISITPPCAHRQLKGKSICSDKLDPICYDKWSVKNDLMCFRKCESFNFKKFSVCYRTIHALFLINSSLKGGCVI